MKPHIITVNYFKKNASGLSTYVHQLERSILENGDVKVSRILVNTGKNDAVEANVIKAKYKLMYSGAVIKVLRGEK